MSYILEALHKEEAERDPAAAVALTQNLAVRRQSRLLRIVLAVLLVTVLFNALLFLKLLRPDDAAPAPPAAPAAGTEPRPAAAATSPSPADPATGRTAAGATPPRPAVPPSPQPAAGRTAVSAPAAPQPAASPGVAGDAGGSSELTPAPAVPRSELPAGVQARLPALSFSTHVYADDADLRAVVLNGRRLKEGESLDSLRLERITEDGVVLGFEDYRISVSVLEEWELP